MAFTITTATTSRGSNDTTDTINLPASVATGDLVIVVEAKDGNSTFTIPSPWVEIKDARADSNAASAFIAYLDATGGETSIDVTTSLSERFNAIAIRITAATWHGTTAPEVSTGATGASTAPDPDSVSASWGAEDNLFIATVIYDGSAQSVDGFPTNYGDNNVEESGGTSSAGVGIATRETTADQADDPDAFTLSGSEQWWSGTIVVRPAAAGAAGGFPGFLALIGVGR